MEQFLQSFPVFLLIFCRITAFFVVVPPFSLRGVPNTFKIGLGFFISLIVFLTYGVNQSIPADAQYILFVIREVLLGLLMGFLVYLFFTVVQTAGALMDLQIGFAMANIVDPMTGISSPMLGNFKYMLLIMVFLLMNGHHYLLTALMDSYQWVPLSNELFGRFAEGNLTEYLTRALGNTFVLALQMASPIVIALFLTDVGLGFLAKTAPQYNVFVVGIPLKIIVGLFVLFLMMPGMAMLFERLLGIMFDNLNQLLGIIRGADSQ
ncbi:flagellar biosynthetic protein FliR [Paenibacillus sp. NPDC058071]|uniref:flagellar biosynthetic protein FliR n=1 Tax=Paenibacillus sp. NPDC058071 TaxID=3346326 RepID=UPI0036DAA073